ncbi:uncharacterized protein Fot_39834 [Forsythia ovata]|uniref:Uncharacterized protein n=1 Tax=Forsythia ovata TaxID=205694 RepID=A0ABD1S5T2_9LAMI
MGIRDFFNSTTEQNAPNITPVKNACRTSYYYGSAAFIKIDNAVRVNGLQRLKQWLPYDETKSKIGTFAAKFAKNAALYALDEGCKMVPGGAAVSNIVSKIIKDVENETLNDNPKPLEERVSAQVKQLSDAQLKEQGETQTNSLYRFNVVLIANQKPEDVAIDRKNLSLSSRL